MTLIEISIVVLCIVNLVLVGLRSHDRIRTDKLRARWAELQRDLRQTKERYETKHARANEEFVNLEQRVNALYKPPPMPPMASGAFETDPTYCSQRSSAANRQDKQECQIDSLSQDIVPTLSAAMGKTRKRGVSTWLSGLLKFFSQKK